MLQDHEKGLNSDVILSKIFSQIYCPEILSTFMETQCKGVKIAIDPFCGTGGYINQISKICDNGIVNCFKKKKYSFHGNISSTSL